MAELAGKRVSSNHSDHDTEEWRARARAGLLVSLVVLAVSGMGLAFSAYKQKATLGSAGSGREKSYSVPIDVPLGSQEIRALPHIGYGPAELPVDSLRLDLTEHHYSDVIAEKLHAEREVETAVGTRCDVATVDVAYEVEWPRGQKPYEAIGQSLHYSVYLGRKPGIIFLVGAEQIDGEIKHVEPRVKMVAERYRIEVRYFNIKTNDWLESSDAR